MADDGTLRQTVTMTDLVETVSSRLTELEAVIDRGVKSFIEVGSALMEIREGGLYKDRGFERFEDYCKERWGMSRSYTFNTIRSAQVAGELAAATFSMENVTERQVRELTPLLKINSDRIPQVWAEVIEATDGQPTAEKVREKVREVLINGERSERSAETNGQTRIIRKPLAVRAKEIEALAVDGASSPQIARQLGITEEQVRKIITRAGLVIPGDQVTNKTRRLDPNHVMEQTVAEISESAEMTIGLLQGRWSDLDPDRIEEWRDSLEAAVRSVNRLIKELSHVAATA